MSYSLFSEDSFNAFNGPYLKVRIGKDLVLMNRLKAVER